MLMKSLQELHVYLNSVQQMVSGESAGECLQTGFERHGLPPQRAPLDTVLGDRFLSSAGAGGNCARPMRSPDPSPVLDKNRAPMGPEILSSTGAGVWRKAPMAFPYSSSVLDKFQSAIFAWICCPQLPHRPCKS